MKSLAKCEMVISKEFEMMHDGNFNLRGKTVIGIPRTFIYKNAVEVEKDCFDEFCEHYNIPSGSRALISDELSDALVLNEKAKKFAITREMYHTRSFQRFIPICFIFANFQLAYTAFYYLRSYLKLKPYQLYSLYLVSTLACIQLYFLGMRLYTRNLERKLDRKCADFDSDLIDGGIQFYHKSIQIRNLIKPYLKEQTEVDKFLQFFRKGRHINLEERKRYFEECLKASELENKIDL